MKEIKRIKIFISCPSDVKNEVDSIRLIIEEINKTDGEFNNYNLALINWKQDTYTAIGEDAQAVINDQVEKEYDVLVGLLWLKVGTPTKRDKSGTIEEINRALANLDKKLLIYFNTSPPENINDINTSELAEINNFKKELGGKGVLYKEFNSLPAFESLFRINITRLIHENLLSDKNTPVVSNDKYKHIENLIETIESRDSLIEDIDFYKLLEEGESFLNIVTSSLSSITNSLNDFTMKIGKRTAEIDQINGLSDTKLKFKKYKIVFNLLSKEIDEFSNRINTELPSFSKNFLAIGPTYSKILQLQESNESSDASALKKELTDLTSSIEYAVTNGASLLESVMKWPLVNFKFNKSKRGIEDALKNLIKEMLEGLKLINEAISN
jgi:hypothetical protein